MKKFFKKLVSLLNPVAMLKGAWVSLLKVVEVRSFIFMLLLIGALLALEIFNYSVTEYTLTIFLGDSRAGFRWATILAIGLCGVDFAGISRLFTPEQGSDEPAEIWYLFAAWLVVATVNALLVWLGVWQAMSVMSLSNLPFDRQALLSVVPVVVALMLWFVRLLVIGTFAVKGDQLFHNERETRQREAAIRRQSRRRQMTIGSRN